MTCIYTNRIIRMSDVHTHIEGCDTRYWAIVLNRIMILLRGAIVYNIYTCIYSCIVGKCAIKTARL